MVAEVLKDGEVRYAGTPDECWVYILKHQPQSVYWACKYGGWEMRPKEEQLELTNGTTAI